MLLTFFTVFYFLFGSSSGFLTKEVCYGDSVNIELKSYPNYEGPLYFYPIAGGERKLLMDNQEAKDPRLKVFSDSVTLTQLTESDNGNFVLISSTGENVNHLSLTISDCSKYIELFYGQDLVHIVPRNVELLEFTPLHRLDQPQLLWERANPVDNDGARRKVGGGYFRISRVTQEDNGYYNLRKKDKSVVSRIHLNVQEKTTYYNAKENNKILIAFPWENGNWTITFTQVNEEGVTIMKSGTVEMIVHQKYRKMSFKNYGIEMCCLNIYDNSTFEFRDSAGNLALVSHVIITGSSYGLLQKQECNGSSVEIDMYPYTSYEGPLYFYPREGEVRNVLMDNREAKDPRLKIYTKSVKLTRLTERDNGKFAIMKNGKVSNILSLTVIDCAAKIVLFTGEELVEDVPSNAEFLEFTSPHSPDKTQVLWQRRNPYEDYGGRVKVSGNVFRISDVTHEDDGDYSFIDKDNSVVLRLQLTVKESTYAFIYIIVAVAVFLALTCYCCCCKKCCCKNKKPHSEAAQAAAEPKVFYQDSTQPEGSGFSAAPPPAAFPPPAGNVNFPPPAGCAAFPPPAGSAAFPPPGGSAAFPPPGGSAAFPPPGGSAAFPPPARSAAFPPTGGSAAFPPPAGSAAFPPPGGSAAVPPPAGNMRLTPPAEDAGILYDVSAASSGPVLYQPTYEIKNIPRPEVAPGASEKSSLSSSCNYNPLSTDYQPMFEVKGHSYNFDLPLNTEISSAHVYKSDKMNFL